MLRRMCYGRSRTEADLPCGFPGARIDFPTDKLTRESQTCQIFSDPQRLSQLKLL
jgi:hypothetical protein